MAGSTSTAFVLITAGAVLAGATGTTSAQPLHGKVPSDRVVSEVEQAEWRAALETSGALPFLRDVTWVGQGFYAQVNDVPALMRFLERRLDNKRTGIFRKGGLHGRHKDIGPDRVDYRSNRGSLGAGSLQVVISKRTGMAFIDMDRFNPYEDVVSHIGHLIEVIHNAWTRPSAVRP
jgi:hypothetical protein